MKNWYLPFIPDGKLLTIQHILSSIAKKIIRTGQEHDVKVLKPFHSMSCDGAAPKCSFSIGAKCKNWMAGKSEVLPHHVQKKVEMTSKKTHTSFESESMRCATHFLLRFLEFFI